jgi:hypothetical protein
MNEQEKNNNNNIIIETFVTRKYVTKAVYSNLKSVAVWHFCRQADATSFTQKQQTH